MILPPVPFLLLLLLFSPCFRNSHLSIIGLWSRKRDPSASPSVRITNSSLLVSSLANSISRTCADSNKVFVEDALCLSSPSLCMRDRETISIYFVPDRRVFSCLTDVHRGPAVVPFCTPSHLPLNRSGGGERKERESSFHGRLNLLVQN